MAGNHLLSEKVFLFHNMNTSTGYVKTILQMFRAFMETKVADDTFLFIERIFIPLITQVFHEGETNVPEIPTLRDWCQHTLRNIQIELAVLPLPEGCPRDCYAQAVTWSEIGIALRTHDVTLDINLHVPQSRKQILWNPDWLMEAQKTYDDFHHLGINDPNRTSLNNHLVLGLNKFLHEFAHCLTVAILDYERDMHNLPVVGAVEVERFDNTPVRLGVKLTKQGDKIIIDGDMGYVLQGLLFGNDLRLKMLRYAGGGNPWRPRGIFFEQGRFEQNINKTGNIVEKAVIFGFEFNQEVTERSFSQNILSRWVAYMAAPTPENAVLWWNSFTVNLEYLSRFDRSTIATIVTKSKKSRKNADTSTNLLYLLKEVVDEGPEELMCTAEPPTIYAGEVRKKC